MSYKVCATRRDLKSVNRTLQVFDASLWEVNVSSGTSKAVYQIVEDDGIYHLYQNGEDTTKTVSIGFIRGLVYEGQQVTITSPGSISMQFGTLHRISSTLEQKAMTKNNVIEEGGLLQGESIAYDNNRLVREEDLKTPKTVQFWYDSRYLRVEVVRNNGYDRFPLQTIDKDRQARIPGMEVSSADQKTLCDTGIICTVGETIRITKKDNSDYQIHLDSIVGYDSLEDITLPNLTQEGIDLKLDGEDGFFEFNIQQDCFAKFSVPRTDYQLWVQGQSISSVNAYSISLTATVDDINYQLYEGRDNLQGDHVSETPLISVSENKVVDLFLAVNMQNDYTVEKFDLLNLNTGTITALQLDSSNHVQFIMPSSMCSISFSIVEEEAEPVQPVTNTYILTIQSPTLSQVTINGNVVSVPGTVEFTTTGNKTATANVVWETSIKSISKVSVYPTGGSPTPAMIKKQKTTDTTIPLGRNMTLEIVTNPISCEYTHINGAISDLSKNSTWSSDNKVVDVVGGSNGNLYEYYNTTETTISNTPNNNPFAGEDVINVSFYTDQSHFGFTNSSFKDCDSLKKVSVSGPSTIAVDTDTFRDSTLKELVGQDKITYLGRASFLGTNLESFENNNIFAIPDLTFNSSALKSINLANAPLTSIGEQVFDNCRSLKHGWLPKTLSYLGDQCFGETAIQAVQTYPTYTEVSAPINSTLKFIVDDDYKNGLTILPKYTFEFCDKLEEVYLPASITHIEKGAFHSCNNLKHFASPGLKTIQSGAFSDTWIEEIPTFADLEILPKKLPEDLDLYKLPNTNGVLFQVGLDETYSRLTYISTNFQNNEELILYTLFEDAAYISDFDKDWKIHSNTISITDHAGESVKKLSKLSFYDSNKLNNIGEFAFANSSVETIEFPHDGNIQLIGKSAFRNCSKLESMDVWKSSIIKIDDYAFENSKNLIPPAFDLTNIEYIGDHAFDGAFNHAARLWERTSLFSNLALMATAFVYVVLGWVLVTYVPGGGAVEGVYYVQ